MQAELRLLSPHCPDYQKTCAPPSILSGKHTPGLHQDRVSFPQTSKISTCGRGWVFLASCFPVHPCLSLISLTQLGKSSSETHGSGEVCEAHAIFLLSSLLLDKEFPEGEIPTLPSLCSPGWVQSSVYTQSECLPYSSFCNIQVFLPRVHTSPQVTSLLTAYISSEEPARTCAASRTQA